MKSETRDKRTGGQHRVFQVEDSTPLDKVKLKYFLSSCSTKDQLTVYLAKGLMERVKDLAKTVIGAYKSTTESNNINVTHLCSTQEEADTKVFLHGIDAVNRGATELHIHANDTDVFILMLKVYPQLCSKSFFVTGTGDSKRSIPIKSVYNTLGALKSAAMPVFHALAGCDQTGRFLGKGKLTCWNALKRCPDDVLSGFASLGTTDELSDETISMGEICV